MVKRIVLTGGPSSGKTSSIQRIVKYFEGVGYNVVVVPETATELILGGLRPFGDKAINMVDFQELVLRLQLAKEEVFELGATYLPNKDTIIIYDRGLIDNRSYVNESEFKEVMARVSKDLNYEEMLMRYDAVIHLETSKKYYRTDNNEARSEDDEKAVLQSKKTLDAWMTHNNVQVVLPKEDFEDKVNEVIDFICAQLSVARYVKQGKYLVDLGDEKIKDFMNGTSLNIEQYYLVSDENVEKRLRKVTCEGRVSYYLSVFKLGDDSKKIVSEKLITEKAFGMLLEFRDKTKMPINKTRYISVRDGIKYCLDVFDGNNASGIIEVSLNGQKQFDVGASFVLSDVTNDSSYQNRNLASNRNMQLLLNA